MVEVVEGPALHWQGRKVGSQEFGLGDGAVEQHQPLAALGLEMLQQQPSHAASANHRHLLLIKGHQLIKPPGLTNLELGQFHGGRADRNGTGTEVGLGANPLARADSLGEQAIENRTNGLVLLAQAHHLLHLGQNLPLSQHQRIEARCHP